MGPLETTLSPPGAPVDNRSWPRCDPPFEEGRLPLVVLYVAVMAVGLPANLLTLLLTWLQVRRGNVVSVYLCGLSLSDLTYLCTLPLWADYVSNRHVWRWSSAFVFFTNMYVSVFLLCCVSCDRCLAVAYGLETRGLRRRRHAVLVAAAMVVLVAAGHTPVFVMKEAGDSDGVRRCFEPDQQSKRVMVLNYARFAVGFLLLLLAVTNGDVLAAVRRSAGLHHQQKRRVRRLAGAVVLLFLLCFGPYHLTLLARALMVQFPQLVPAHCQFERSLYTPYSVSLALATVNSAVNPLLYVLSSSGVREDCHRGLVLLRLWARPRWNTSSQRPLELLGIRPRATQNPAGPQRRPGAEPNTPLRDQDKHLGSKRSSSGTKQEVCGSLSQ